MRALFLACLWTCAAFAQGDVPGDVEREAHVAKIATELRCMVCQNQSIADSHADLAADLRQQIREQLDAGRSDDEIRAYMVERYGDFILYRPPFKSATLLLWFGPALLVIFGLVMLTRHMRSRRAIQNEAPLSADEHARAGALLETEKFE